MCTCDCGCLQNLEEDTQSPGAGVTGGYELSYVDAGNWIQVHLQDQYLLLTVEPFLQSHHLKSPFLPPLWFILKAT